ncbi:DUF2993 domain-containing protein [Nocardia sp. NBC_00511]|uniref:LmeA family phospholipid-binding protein n=1 Tax=Nocardia sp. NBC_00511 TaxID=2903591 RepID=UPI0030DF2751
MRGLLTLIVVLAIALVAGDRIAVVLVQNEIGRRIASEYQLSARPAVDINGFPFLTQAVDGTYGDIDIRVGDWTDKQITVHNLDVTLDKVSAPLGDIANNRTENLVAATATATALVPYTTVQPYAPAGVESISNGQNGLDVTGTFTVGGIPIPATVVVTVAPTDDGIQITPVSVQAAAGGPMIPLALLRDTLTFTVPLQQLPVGAKLTSIQPTPAGLQVTAVAHNVHFSDLPK